MLLFSTHIKSQQEIALSHMHFCFSHFSCFVFFSSRFIYLWTAWDNNLLSSLCPIATPLPLILFFIPLLSSHSHSIIHLILGLLLLYQLPPHSYTCFWEPSTIHQSIQLILPSPPAPSTLLSYNHQSFIIHLFIYLILDILLSLRLLPHSHTPLSSIIHLSTHPCNPQPLQFPFIHQFIHY